MRILSNRPVIVLILLVVGALAYGAWTALDGVEVVTGPPIGTELRP